ncbi:hypothetical protein HUT13_10905 [Streptomyces harbinensis]|uniref:hypothetical protein n=2 Tax=Streptomyces harbinensis TaxID=1176198 RepID=UPI001591BE8C|nr:hypothetical protein [Streptomyces harbinensis]QKV69233.1 hypothetical protein HUT13_10905 [Streptomyces harbinensis]
MPSYDMSRDRFRLSHQHVAVLGQLHDGEQVIEELTAARDELIAVGLVSEQGELSPVLNDLVTALAKPVIVVDIEMTGPHGITTHGVLIGEEAVFSFEEWPGFGENEYTRIEPRTLVFELARLVGLRDRTTGDPAGGITTVESTMKPVDDVFTGLAQLPEGAVSSQADLVKAADDILKTSAGDLPEDVRTLFAGLIVGMRSSWRMTVAWPGTENGAAGTKVSAFAVWDCDTLGHWLRELPAEPIMEGQITPQSPLRLVRTSAKDLWEKIADTLPNGDEIRSADN